jgi:ribosomal protein L7Ae-like RNA K-turn-binding protein
MSTNQTLSALALARRAGKLVMGFDAVMKSVQKGETSLVVLASGLSPKTVKEAEFRSKRLNAVVLTADISLDEAEYVLGKRAGIFGITDKGFRRLVETAAGSPTHTD